MARKAFNLVKPTDVVEFDLEGKTFRCRPRVSAGLIMRFADVMGGPEDEEPDTRAAVRIMKEFFQNVIVTDDFPVFWDMIEDPELAVPVETLTDIANWLAEQYTDRPTGLPSSTGQGSESSGVASTAVVYSRESTSPPSTPPAP